MGAADKERNLSPPSPHFQIEVWNDKPDTGGCPLGG